MVDVTQKPVTVRKAVAEGSISLSAQVIGQLERLKKGNAFEVARLAGISAAKKTWDLIPLCHPLALSGIDVEFQPDAEHQVVWVRASVTCSGQTGVEMEAMTAVSVALLTIYDMTKAVARESVISNVRLIEKVGGKTGHWKRKPKG